MVKSFYKICYENGSPPAPFPFSGANNFHLFKLTVLELSPQHGEIGPLIVDLWIWVTVEFQHIESTNKILQVSIKNKDNVTYKELGITMVLILSTAILEHRRLNKKDPFSFFWNSEWKGPPI